MSDELTIVQPAANSMAVPKIQKKEISTEVEKDLTTGSKFLPRIQIAGSSSMIVKEGKIGVGRIALIQGKNVVDLGTKITGIFIDWRAKALRYSEGSAQDVYNTANPLFDEIRSGALAGGQNNPNQFGPEFLFYIFDHNVLCHFFNGSTSQRNEGTLGIKLCKDQQASGEWKPVKVEIELAKNKKFAWHVARILEHDQEVPAEKFPQPDVYTSALEKFLNPKDTEPKEKAEAATSERD